MAIILHNYNIVRVVEGDHVAECTVLKMCYDYAVVKYKGKQYKVAYDLMNAVVGHELLVPHGD